jgi:cation diffusion facilitator CzcD-associated flavoprotein CzcO
MRVAIIGAGAGGIAMGVSLGRAGIDYTIYEKADGVGGTWRDNTYPGAQCDIRSHMYSFSFEPKKDWSRLYAEQPEILAYLEATAAKHGILEHLRPNTPIAEARWDDDAARWRLHSEAGEVFEAEVLVTGLGMLNVPSYPDISGIDDFAGPVFHSSRWRHDVDLAGRRVGVIGTGASALQFVPRIAPDVAHLTVFQRTPQWVMPTADRPYTEKELRRLRLPLMARLERLKIFLRYERMTSFRLDDRQTSVRHGFGLANLERGITDPHLRARLLPDYPIGCKRLIQSNDWYPTLAQPHVDVVGDEISHVVPAGVVTADGETHPLDVLVLGTGFKASEYLCAVDVHGVGGRSLRDDWAGGAEAYRGVTVAGYPNLFTLYGPNTNQGGNSIIFILESQVRFVMRALRLLRRRRARTLEVRRDAMDGYNRWLQSRMGETVWAGGCNSYYVDDSGKITTQWPHRASRYRWLTRRIRPKDFVVS